MKLYGIIGYPLGHSFSKKYFTDKFLREAVTGCSYETFPMESIDEIKQLLINNPTLCGLNVTIPHKKNVIAFLDDTTKLPKGLTACNCIKIKNKKLVGYNTDVVGFEQSLVPLLKKYHTDALILGNGGAAEAVKFVLDKLHINYQVVSRRPHQVSHLSYEDVTATLLKKNLLIINTTPLGTFPNVNEYPDILYQHLSPKHFLYDVVYNPAKTMFLQKGEAHGAIIKNGYDMLVIQAEESWRIWNE